MHDVAAKVPAHLVFLVLGLACTRFDYRSRFEV